MTWSIRQLKFGILECVAAERSHKLTIIGRPMQRGRLEGRLGSDFDADERFRADRAFEELKSAGLIRPDYPDIANPESWVVITDAGRVALQRHALDSLDAGLTDLDPHLVVMRDGAWAALGAGTPDALRQAAHSARELIDHVLRKSAPDEGVRMMAGFKPDPESKNGITRRHRLKYAMNKHRGRVSDSDLEVVESAAALVDALSRSLTASSHASKQPKREDVEDGVRTGEMALRRILLKSE